MSLRKPISKKTRFEVFKRDGFCCQYCGAHPSDSVMLEIDHIHPVSRGGKNDIDNLVSACLDCNRGKGANLLSSVPQSLSEKAKIAQEREAQIIGYYEILEGIKQRKESELWAVADIFMDRFGDDSIQRLRLDSIRNFLSRLNYYEVIEAMEIASGRFYSKQKVFSYFCGICWRKIKREAGDFE